MILQAITFQTLDQRVSEMTTPNVSRSKGFEFSRLEAVSPNGRERVAQVSGGRSRGFAVVQFDGDTEPRGIYIAADGKLLNFTYDEVNL
jgi:hypothetical protein